MNSSMNGARGLGVWMLLALIAAVIPGSRAISVSAQSAATPAAGFACADSHSPATPTMDHGAMAGGSTPAAGMTMEFDQSYIDMMIPHHASIVALAQAALPRLTDGRLIAMAEAIIDAQAAEIAELGGYRADWYGSAMPAPMSMDAMMAMMPAGMMMSSAEMMTQMDPHAQVAAFCAATDPDLAFIELVIPHHESAIAVSRTALGRATHDELKAFAQHVIDDQQREIDELVTIKDELLARATPAR